MAGERLLTVADDPETWVQRHHLNTVSRQGTTCTLTVKHKCPKTKDQNKKSISMTPKS